MKQKSDQLQPSDKNDQKCVKSPQLFSPCLVYWVGLPVSLLEIDYKKFDSHFTNCKIFLSTVKHITVTELHIFCSYLINNRHYRFTKTFYILHCIAFKFSSNSSVLLKMDRSRESLRTTKLLKSILTWCYYLTFVVILTKTRAVVALF